MESTDRETLERLLDTYGMEDLLDSIAGICFDKSEYVVTNWQDERLARVWQVAGMKLDQVKISKPINSITLLSGYHD